MSLLPFIFEDFDTCRPFHLAEGLPLGKIDLLMPLTVPQHINKLMRKPTFVYYCPRRSGSGKENVSKEEMDKDQFQVSLDVQHFSPEEITVKISGDNLITVEAKHVEKQDEHGYVARQFVRKCVLPKGHDIEKIQSKLSSDGVLTIIAPKITENEIKDRTIPIQQSEVPSKPVKKNETEEEKEPQT